MLAKNPDTLITVDDGAPALAAIRQLKIEEHLLSGTETGAIEYATHPTHWIVAMLLNRPKLTEPLHRLICFPKSKYTEKEITEHLNDYARELLPFVAE